MEQVNENLCAQFAFKFAHYQYEGKSVSEALVMAGNDFKKEIKYMQGNDDKEGGIRAYLFTDGTYCTYNVKEGYFKFRSPIKNKAHVLR